MMRMLESAAEKHRKLGGNLEDELRGQSKRLDCGVHFRRPLRERSVTLRYATTLHCDCTPSIAAFACCLARRKPLYTSHFFLRLQNGEKRSRLGTTIRNDDYRP